MVDRFLEGSMGLVVRRDRVEVAGLLQCERHEEAVELRGVLVLAIVARSRVFWTGHDLRHSVVFLDREMSNLQ